MTPKPFSKYVKIHQYMLTLLEANGGSMDRLSDKTGLSKQTLIKLLTAEITEPNNKVLERLGLKKTFVYEVDNDIAL